MTTSFKIESRKTISDEFENLRSKMQNYKNAKYEKALFYLSKTRILEESEDVKVVTICIIDRRS